MQVVRQSWSPLKKKKMAQAGMTRQTLIHNPHMPKKKERKKKKASTSSRPTSPETTGRWKRNNMLMQKNILTWDLCAFSLSWVWWLEGDPWFVGTLQIYCCSWWSCNRIIRLQVWHQTLKLHDTINKQSLCFRLFSWCIHVTVIRQDTAKLLVV